jgi:hypothetical protein
MMPYVTRQHYILLAGSLAAAGCFLWLQQEVSPLTSGRHSHNGRPLNEAKVCYSSPVLNMGKL